MKIAWIAAASAIALGGCVYDPYYDVYYEPGTGHPIEPERYKRHHAERLPPPPHYYNGLYYGREHDRPDYEERDPMKRWLQKRDERTWSYGDHYDDHHDHQHEREHHGNNYYFKNSATGYQSGGFLKVSHGSGGGAPAMIGGDVVYGNKYVYNGSGFDEDDYHALRRDEIVNQLRYIEQRNDERRYHTERFVDERVYSRF